MANKKVMTEGQLTKDELANIIIPSSLQGILNEYGDNPKLEKIPLCVVVGDVSNYTFICNGELCSIDGHKYHTNTKEHDKLLEFLERFTDGDVNVFAFLYAWSSCLIHRREGRVIPAPTGVVYRLNDNCDGNVEVDV